MLEGPPRFTHQATQSINLAEKFTRDMRLDVLGPEHILVGLMSEKGGVAFTLMKNLSVDPEQVIQSVKSAVSSQKHPLEVSKFQLSEDTKGVLESAVGEVRQLGHYYIGTHHLLLGILSYRKNLAADILKKYRLNHNKVQKEIRHILLEASVDELSEKTHPDRLIGLSQKAQAGQIRQLQNSVKIYGHILRTVTQEQAQTWRDQNDAPHGWSVLEVLGHVTDFDGFFYDRAQMMLKEDDPRLPAYDHDALVSEHAYNQQDKAAVHTRLVESRARFVDFFEQLTDDQWGRAGIHPERGHFTVLDALMQAANHDITHLEQMTRIIADSTD